MDLAGLAGNRHSLVRACFANGQPDAAEYLAGGGAPLDLPGAAGVGRLDVVHTFFDEGARLRGGASRPQMCEAFSLACAFGRAGVADFMLDRGIDVNAELSHHGRGHTGLHSAAYRGHVDVVKLLLERGAGVHLLDRNGERRCWSGP